MVDDIKLVVAKFAGGNREIRLVETRCVASRGQYLTIKFDTTADGTPAALAYKFTGWRRQLDPKPVLVGHPGGSLWAVNNQGEGDRAKGKTIKMGRRTLRTLREAAAIEDTFLDM